MKGGDNSSSSNATVYLPGSSQTATGGGSQISRTMKEDDVTIVIYADRKEKKNVS